MEKNELLKAIDNFDNKLNELKEVLKVDKLKEENLNLEKKTLTDGFWQDAKEAKKVIDNLNYNKDIISNFDKLQKSLEDIKLIIDLDDEEMFLQADDLVDDLDKNLDDAFNLALLNGEYDRGNCYLEIHPGAGGTESQDWALMLFRMYKRFCEKHNFKLTVLDYLEATDAGIKSVTCLIEGINAYGMLQSESGVHRLVRISPFDSQSRRHTSFAGVGITPDVEANDVEINPNDLRIDTYRSSGAGGQYVNTTDSAVRITHLPTGIVVSCQNERSQIQNRIQCMKLLSAKLYQLESKKNQELLTSISGNNLDNAFGSQIRSYILQPYTLVKDHRTNYEVGNFTKVLDGDLDGFINSYLKYKAKGGNNEEN